MQLHTVRAILCTVSAYSHLPAGEAALAFCQRGVYVESWQGRDSGGRFLDAGVLRPCSKLHDITSDQGRMFVRGSKWAVVLRDRFSYYLLFVYLF